ncbi:pyridoxamine 5'-phosphate oxidase-like protein [Prauserella shujinwangii]|uniref:Pyridoxamine 5'-phosphate oxidase-like protein n=1 Tax=Prauserella shujinwangii TaxID=1453103 RepID=A0A2T0LPR4_9PSEU|nr:pyridoxamine 5'-phosphate oxidase family protein [Prauserella shujinwangii]PRX45194.1 pyridoxamine 5'-phosphate oxidase-like protein [Prauserella shujinwangii]
MLDPFGLEVLDRARCLALLAGARLGRVVFTHRGLPAVQLVRFALRGENVVCEVPPGSALFAAAHGTVVAFEADDFAADLSAGWSVTVLGRLREAREPALLAGLPPLSWRPDPEDRHLTVSIEVVSGSRLA